MFSGRRGLSTATLRAVMRVRRAGVGLGAAHLLVGADPAGWLVTTEPDPDRSAIASARSTGGWRPGEPSGLGAGAVRRPRASGVMVCTRIEYGDPRWIVECGRSPDSTRFRRGGPGSPPGVVDLQGRICLPYTLYWGFRGLLLIYVLDPATAQLIEWMPRPVRRACSPC